MQTKIYLNVAGIEFEIDLKYVEPRKAPPIDLDNYDNTLCDCGDDGELEVLNVKVGGKSIPCDKEEFLDFFREYIMEELEG